MSSEPTSARPRARDRSSTWLGIGLVLCLLISATVGHDVLRTGFASSGLVGADQRRNLIAISDVTFEAWLVARNAYTLSRQPLSLFDTGHCHPEEQSLVFGIPMITMGLLAIPVSFFTPNPAIAYNFATLMIWLLSGLAMYLLVKEWTGVAAAGVVAGILYAFSPLRLGENVVHPSVWDGCWTVFALYFSQRLFAHGLWRDAIGLAAACSLQMAASFYPLLASVLLAPCYAIWLVHRYRLRHVRVAQLVFVASVSIATAMICFGPYLEARTSGALSPRTDFFFARWSWFAPGNAHFFGWATLLLALVGLLVPARLAVPRLGGDPRWLLLTGALLIAIVSMGPFGAATPFGVLDLHALLASAIPGVDTVRVAARLTVALQITLCLCAGLGAAWLIRVAGERGPVLAGLLLAFGTATTLSAQPLPRATPLSVPASEVQFFADLAALGNDGPILELPVGKEKFMRTLTSARLILAASYHRRRTWTCFGSFDPPERRKVTRIVERLPDRIAQHQLRELGFTTIILRPVGPSGQLLQHRLERDARNGPRLLLAADSLRAYELRESHELVD